MGNCIGSRLKRNKSPPRYDKLNDEKFDSLDDVPDLVSSDSEDGPEQDTIRVFSYDATAFFQHDGEIFAADRNNNLVQLVTLADIWKAVDSEFGEDVMRIRCIQRKSINRSKDNNVEVQLKRGKRLTDKQYRTLYPMVGLTIALD